MGLAGAALAFTCSQGTSALLLVLYTVVRDARMAAQGHEEATWCRPSCAMFAGEWTKAAAMIVGLEAHVLLLLAAYAGSTPAPVHRVAFGYVCMVR